MGGPATPSVGWAAGVERLSMLLATSPGAPRPVAVIPVSEAEEAVALRVLQTLRGNEVVSEMAYKGNLKRRIERANKRDSSFAVIIGSDEVARGALKVRDMGFGREFTVKLPGTYGYVRFAMMLKHAQRDSEANNMNRLSDAISEQRLETVVLASGERDPNASTDA